MTVLTVVLTHTGKCSQSQTSHLEEQKHKPSFIVHYIKFLNLNQNAFSFD